MTGRKCEMYAGVSDRHAPIEKSNVGHKMLEKMGWMDGLGLGKNNQGIKKILSYRHKICKTGLRTTDERNDEVLPHQSAFEDLLNQLNTKDNGVDVKPLASPSLSDKQKCKKVQVRQGRYMKMIQAKEVMNYAVKDLDGILGKRKKKNYSLQCNEEDTCSSIVLDERNSEINKQKGSAQLVKQSPEMNGVDNEVDSCFQTLTANDLDITKSANYSCATNDKQETIQRKRKKRSRILEPEQNFEITSRHQFKCPVNSPEADINENLSSSSHNSEMKLCYVEEKHSYPKNEELGVVSNKKKRIISKKQEVSETCVQPNTTQVISVQNRTKGKEDYVSNSEFYAAIQSGFAGANLHQIKGYGHW